jgi:hypothetical protein
MGTVVVLLDRSGPATDPQAFGRWAGELAGELRQAGGATAYEVWNEPDDPSFWGGAVDAARYASLLEAAAPPLRRGDPGATVLLGALTGNNFSFLRQVYDAGARASFDGVAVHTDTACLVDPPTAFARDRDGRIGRFSFLGLRSVREVMVARGDARKGIWMTELGWSTATTPCARGAWAGRKPAGVPEPVQAQHLTQAYGCLARYPYVVSGLWFTLDDSRGNGPELDSYGLRRLDGTRRPAWDAFRAIATRGSDPAVPCGDLDGPQLRLDAPGSGSRFVGVLGLRALATDPSGVARVTFRANGRTIRSFTGADVASGRVVGLDWQGAKRLAVGRHRITVLALDPHGNRRARTIVVRKVRRLPATLPTSIRLAIAVAPGRVATVTGRVSGPPPGLQGRVEVQWQVRSAGRWRTRHKRSAPAGRPFRVAQRLARAGTWRVRAVYRNVPPHRRTAATTGTVRVR